MHLNKETGSYVYRIIAMKEVIEHPELYGYKKYYDFGTNRQSAELVALN